MPRRSPNARAARAPERLNLLVGLSGLALAAALALVCSPGLTAVDSATSAYASTAGTATFDASSTPDVSGTVEASATTTSVAPLRTIVGHSVRGRAIVRERFGSGPRHILIVGGVHGDEAGGPVAALFAAYLRSHPSAIASGTQVDVIAYANPDGRARNRRTNARKVDLNRNFPTRNWTRKRDRPGVSHGKYAGSEPETKTLVRVLKSGHYIRVVSLHSRGGVVDPNGAGSTSLAKRIAKAAHIRVHRLPAYHGSMGTYVPEKFHVPLITWELSSRSLTKRVRAGLLVALR